MATPKKARKKAPKKAPQQNQAPSDPSRPPCPECGTPMVRIVYGYPSAETFERSRRGEFALGGCVVTGVDATHVCEQGHRWRRRGGRSGLDPSSLAGVVVPGHEPAPPGAASTSEWISMADPWDDFYAELDSFLAERNAADEGNDDDPGAPSGSPATD